MINLTNILEQEQLVANLVKQLKQDIVETTKTTPLDGVTPLAKNICVVKLSAIRDNIWSPEYYIPEKQAEYIGESLSSITTASAFVKKVNEIIENKFVKIGSNKYPINNETISILQRYI